MISFDELVDANDCIDQEIIELNIQHLSQAPNPLPILKQQVAYLSKLNENVAIRVLISSLNTTIANNDH
ncbi:MAG: hypothetical protein HAW67_06005, partial [Endozoicomonadaceae bacterium]|nr:hypothetical protein [Endozoicomonadaceae bacterium]